MLDVNSCIEHLSETYAQVIEKRGGKGESSEQEQVKERITAQLEASSEHIRVLEARLERLKISELGWHIRTRPNDLTARYTVETASPASTAVEWICLELFPWPRILSVIFYRPFVCLASAFPAARIQPHPRSRERHVHLHTLSCGEHAVPPESPAEESQYWR